MRTDTINQDEYRYQLWAYGMRFDTGSAVDTEEEAARQLNNRLAEMVHLTGTIQVRKAGKTRFRTLYQVDNFS